MTPLLNFAIVGYGHIGRRHALHIMEREDCRLVAVCDVDPTALNAAPEGVLKFASLAQMIEGLPDLQVLCVCTPNGLHAEQTETGLLAGFHVIVEKPMALSTAECDRMIAAALKSGKEIFAVKQNRYNPPVRKVKELLETGALGNILMMQVNCFWNRGDAYYAQSSWRGTKALDGGCLFTQFSHFVDILYYLNGPVIKASGIIRNFLHRHNTELEDTGSFTMEAANGAVINFNFTTCSYRQNMEGSIAIFAEHGSLKIGGQYLNTIEYQQLKGESLPEISIGAKANDYGLYKGSMSNHDKVIENVADVLLHGKPVMTSATEGKEVVRIIELMYAGAVH